MLLPTSTIKATAANEYPRLLIIALVTSLFVKSALKNSPVNRVGRVPLVAQSVEASTKVPIWGIAPQTTRASRERQMTAWTPSPGVRTRGFHRPPLLIMV